jgi:hypothetical protein
MKDDIKKIQDVIDSAGGTIFSVEFTKRDGSRRSMTCRRHVTKGVTGVGFTNYVPIEHQNLIVHEMPKSQFRTVKLSSPNLKIKVKGITHVFNRTNETQ